MRSDEEKALRLRRAQLQAELARIEVLLSQYPPTTRPNPIGDDFRKARQDFYRDAENDFRNTDSNGNYVTPPEDC